MNPFGSNFTLLNARDGSVIVPSTNSLSDFYLGWTQIDHERLPTALSLPDVVRALRNITAVAAETEQRDSSNARGAQLALIVVPGSATVSDADNEFALQELGLLRNERPDMTLLFLAGGVPTRFSRYVRDASRDLFTLQTLGTNAENVAVQTIPVTQRIQTGRRDNSVDYVLLTNVVTELFMHSHSQSPHHQSALRCQLATGGDRIAHPEPVCRTWQPELLSAVAQLFLLRIRRRQSTRSLPRSWLRTDYGVHVANDRNAAVRIRV